MIKVLSAIKSVEASELSSECFIFFKHPFRQRLHKTKHNYMKKSLQLAGVFMLLLFTTVFSTKLNAQVIVEGFEEAAWPTTYTNAAAAGTVTVNPYTTTTSSNVANSNTGVWYT